MRLSFFLLLSAQWGLSVPFIDDTGEDKWSFSLVALNWIEWHWTFILASVPDCSSPSSTASTSILPIWKVRHRLLKLWCKIRVCVCAKSCLTLCNPTDCSPWGSSVHGIFHQEYWSGLPFPPPEDLPDPKTEPVSNVSPALAGVFLITVPLRKQ